MTSSGGPSDPVVAVGDIVADKFRVERVIDEGGMGIVVEATHLVLEERVALKFLRREILGMEGFVSRFAHEARAAVKLKSEHVARVIDVGNERRTGPFMVMEYLEGQDLRGVLHKVGRLGAPAAVEYIIQACEGVSEAHARGIIHRDIKPENLFLAERSDDWRIIKVLDFGISKLRGKVTDHEGASNTLSMMGSPCYMSPEQIRSTKTVDHRADVWSLGAVLFELLGGVPPFDASRPFPEIIAAVLEEPPRPLAELAPDIPDGLERVILRCLEKDPANRYQSAAELALALLPYAARRARVPVERAIAISRAAGLLSDPNQTLPPSGAPGASERSSAIGASVHAPAARVPIVSSTPPAESVSAAPPAPSQTPPQDAGSAFARTRTISPPDPPVRRRSALWLTLGALALLGVGAAVALVGRGGVPSDAAPAVTNSAAALAPPSATASAPVAPEPAASSAEPEPAASSATAPATGLPAGRFNPQPSRQPRRPDAPSSTPPSRPAPPSPELEIRRTR